jgi:hypothetical protein
MTACGGAATSGHAPSTVPPATSSASPLPKKVEAGHLTFRLPASWVVGYGTCRCSWGSPATATLDNGPQQGGVVCNCPEESATAPSELHLYEGQGGLVGGGRPTVIDGSQATVSVDPSTTTVTATFPAVDQWITISPAPEPRPALGDLTQLALEQRILATVTVNAAGDSP